MKVIKSVVFETPNSNQGHIFSYQWAMITLGRAAVDESCLSRGASSDHCGTGETIKTKPLSSFILWKEIRHFICILRLSALAGLEDDQIQSISLPLRHNAELTHSLSVCVLNVSLHYCLSAPSIQLFSMTAYPAQMPERQTAVHTYRQCAIMHRQNLWAQIRHSFGSLVVLKKNLCDI